jgi:hypothetical protein
MNCLAQAFNQLCDAKPRPAAVTQPIVIAPSVIPVRDDAQTDQAPIPAIEPADNPPPVLPAPPPLDPARLEAASAAARRGLATKRAVFGRIAVTRKLIRAWAQMGQYLADPAARIRTKDEALDLARQLTIIRQQLQLFPPLIGQAGQPGYYVIALARQPRIVQTFQALSASERQRLGDDWEAALRFLAAHRLFLRDEIWALRRQTWLGRLGRTARAFFTDYPIVWLALIGLLALNIAHPPLRADWLRQLLVIAAALGGFLVYQTYRTWAQRASLQRRRRRGDRKGEAKAESRG